MKRNLFLRTDVLPEEIPILFSNKNVYLPFTQQKMIKFEEVENCFEFITIPYYYFIPKNGTESRKMALLHPIAQLQIFRYMLRYEQMILEYCSRSNFSVRSPIKRNIPKINLNKSILLSKNRVSQEFNFFKEGQVTTEEDEILFMSYFSYNKFKKINDLYKSVKFNRAKYKYNYLMRLDIQNFFPSIYTHALSWALLGSKSIAKRYKNESNLFANATDKICQKINFNETSGIVVGPEFSRVVAELLLTTIDITLLKELRNLNKILDKDYKIFRFMDDFFVFASTKEEIDSIASILYKIVSEYNLNINVSKNSLQTKPILISDNSVIELKKIIQELELSILLNEKSESNHNDLNYEMNEEIFYTNFLKGSKYDWNDLSLKIEDLIHNNLESSRKIINFFLKVIRKKIIVDMRKTFLLMNIIEIITNIYSLNINYTSTHLLITNFIKIYYDSKNIKLNAQINLSSLEKKIESQFFLDDKSKEELFSTENLLKNNISKETIRELKDIRNTIEHSILIEEALFHQSYSVLKNNYTKLNDMYELFIYMKLLDKKLSASFLCSIIEKYSESYFILCSISYYILNEEQTEIDKRYQTVRKKLINIILKYIDSYESKGTDSSILEGDFFYFLNDFSFYPGFDLKILKKLKSKMSNEYKEMINKKNNINSDEKESKLEIWSLITKRSYFDWNQRPEDFTRKVVKKSSIIDSIDANYS